MTKLYDARGTNQGAQVDSRGRLYTRSNPRKELAHHTLHLQDSFVTSATLTTADGNEAPLFFIINNEQDKDLEIHDMHISSESNVLIKLYKEATYSSGGVALTPVNMNLSSNVSRDVTVYEGGASDDLALTTTNAELMFSKYIGAYQPNGYNWEGSIIIPYNKAIYITAQGVASDIIKCNVTYTWTDDDG